MNKRIIASILCAGMILTMSGVAFAQEDNQPQDNQQQTEQQPEQTEQKEQTPYVKPQRYEVLVLGDSDQEGESYIKELQSWLIKYGHLEGEPTGYYGEQTQKAVLEFQTAHQMSVDGKAGPITRKILMGPEYKAISEGRTVLNANGTGIDEFSTGDRGPEIKKVQERLKALGYYTYENITDFYGPVTEEAVLQFKKANGLDAASSVIDGQTYNAIFSSGAKTKAQVTQQTTTTKKTTTKKKTTTTKKQTNSNPSAPVNGTGIEAMISAGQAKTGCSYYPGGTGPNTFDCSGFVQYAARAAGKSIPRTTYDQANAGQRVNRSQLRRGDLVMFYASNASGGSIEHSGIYLGGGTFIHATSGSAYSVTTSSIDSDHYSKRFSHGVRIF